MVGEELGDFQKESRRDKKEKRKNEEKMEKVSIIALNEDRGFDSEFKQERCKHERQHRKYSRCTLT